MDNGINADKLSALLAQKGDITRDQVEDLLSDFRDNLDGLNAEIEASEAEADDNPDADQGDNSGNAGA